MVRRLLVPIFTTLITFLGVTRDKEMAGSTAFYERCMPYLEEKDIL